jgi:hypothetical protein
MVVVATLCCNTLLMMSYSALKLQLNNMNFLSFFLLHFSSNKTPQIVKHVL